MDTFVAVVFNDEASAFKGSEALRELHSNGDLIIYAGAVISKDAEGNVSVKQGAGEGPLAQHLAC